MLIWADSPVPGDREQLSVRQASRQAPQDLGAEAGTGAGPPAVPALCTRALEEDAGAGGTDAVLETPLSSISGGRRQAVLQKAGDGELRPRGQEEGTEACESTGPSQE